MFLHDASSYGFVACRQTTPFTCGPATCVAAGRLVGLDFNEADLARTLLTDPASGTRNDVLLQWALRNFDLRDDAPGPYAGGLAIANIRNPFSGRGHFVLMLDGANDTTRYYCPHIDAVVQLSRDAIDWRSGDGTLTGWCVNLTRPMLGQV